LRDYQRPAVEDMVRAKRGILFAAPGAGKTAMAAAVMQRLAHCRPALFLVERKELAYQAQDALSGWLGQKVGLIGGGQTKPSDCGVYVGMVQTLSGRVNRFPQLERCRLLICDEVHHAAAMTYVSLAASLKDCWRVFGLSGTPWRTAGDDLLLEGSIGPIRHTITYDDLIDKGHLTAPICIFAHMPRGGSQGYDWPSQYEARIVNFQQRNDCAVSFADWVVRKAGRTCVVLVERIEHGEELATRLGCPFTHGTSSSSKRRQILRDLREGGIDLAVSTLYREAVDIPRLDAVVNASGGKSSIRFYQMMRNLRTHPGKKVALILDFVDQGRWVRDHSQERMALSKIPRNFKVVETRDWALSAEPDQEACWGWLRWRIKNG
jgi:superfamily II DNA or RNA helicase